MKARKAKASQSDVASQVTGLDTSPPSSGPVDVPAPVADPGIMERSASTDAAPQERLSFPVKPDGTIDFDGVRAATREKMKRAGISIPGDEDTAPAEGFTTQQCRDLYQTYYSVQRTVATMFLRIPPDIAGLCFNFDEDQFQEREALTRRVLAKHAKQFRFKDEIMLGLMLSNDLVRRFVIAKAMLMAKAQQTAGASPQFVNGQQEARQ